MRGRAPTRGAPTDGLGVHRWGEGAHKGRPYGWIRGAQVGGGHPQGVPLRDGLGVHRWGEGAHKGRPYGWIRGAQVGEGTHKGCPYEMD